MTSTNTSTSLEDSSLHRRRDTRELPQAHFVNVLLNDNENEDEDSDVEATNQKASNSVEKNATTTTSSTSTSTTVTNKNSNDISLEEEKNNNNILNSNHLKNEKESNRNNIESSTSTSTSTSTSASSASPVKTQAQKPQISSLQVKKEKEQDHLISNQDKGSLSPSSPLTNVIKCEVPFKYRPFGFSISADEHSLNAVVTKVYTWECIKKGICIGYCVARINGVFVLDKPHSVILEMIRSSKLPCVLAFTDRGQDCQATFRNKPLGFSILRDENKRNAKVHEVKSIQAQASGVCADWVLIKVNDVDVWGKLHDEIVAIIKMEPLPITCTFRVTPPLQKSQSSNS